VFSAANRCHVESHSVALLSCALISSTAQSKSKYPRKFYSPRSRACVGASSRFPSNPVAIMSPQKNPADDKKGKKQQHLQVDLSSTFIYDLILWLLSRMPRVFVLKCSYGRYFLSRNPESWEFPDSEEGRCYFCGCSAC
jgi:hypothetical protein